MTEMKTTDRGLWRILVWGGMLALWLLPLAAMQLTKDVQWTPFDFGVWGVMLLAAGGAFELAARTSSNLLYRLGAGTAIVTTFLLVWVNLAVGVIGAETNPANLMFGGVLAVGVTGAALARMKASGMALTLLITAAAQAAVGLVALAQANAEREALMAITGGFTVLWLLSALLFSRAGPERSRPQ